MITGFEQFVVGQTFTSPTHQVDVADIKAFAAQFDFQPQHIDPVAAGKTMFGTLVASGWHTASLTMRLILQSGMGGISGRGLGVRVSDLSWSAPVYPGDTLHAVSEVLELRPSRSKPDRGLVVVRTITYNQHDKPVQELTSTLMILRSDAVI